MCVRAGDLEGYRSIEAQYASAMLVFALSLPVHIHISMRVFSFELVPEHKMPNPHVMCAVLVNRRALRPGQCPVNISEKLAER